MIKVIVSEQQAREFARAIIDEIAFYVKEHQAEYQAYLIETGQKDE